MNCLVPLGIRTASVLTKASCGFMQVATHSQVLLFDMLRLQESQALDTCLTSLLQSSSIVKLGCRLSDDVSKLHRSYPGMQAFQQALALLDLTGPWSLYMQTYNSQVSLVGLLQQQSAEHMPQRARVSTDNMNYAVPGMSAFLLWAIPSMWKKHMLQRPSSSALAHVKYCCCCHHYRSPLCAVIMTRLHC